MSGFYRLSEELLSMIVCELDGLHHDIESLKIARLVHPRLAVLRTTNRLLFGTLQVFPEPESQRTVKADISAISPYIHELVIFPALPKDDVMADDFMGHSRRARDLLSAVKVETATQPAKTSFKRTVNLFRQLTQVKTISFAGLHGDGGYRSEFQESETIVIFFLWCLGRAKVKPHTIRFGAVPVSKDRDLGRRHDDDEHSRQYKDATREQRQTAWKQLDVSELKVVCQDAAHECIDQSLEGLYEILDTLGQPQLDRLEIKRLNSRESVCLGSSWPFYHQTALRHLCIDGGHVQTEAITAWVAAIPHLSDVALARISSNDVRGDSIEDAYDASLEVWQELFTAVRNHPNRMLVRLTDIPGYVAEAQPEHDIDVAFILVRHTSIRTPQHDDKFCKMLMEIHVGIWKLERVARLRLT